MKTSKRNQKRTAQNAKEPADKKEKAVPDIKVIPNIKELLLSGPKFDLIIPKRKRWKRRPPVIFE